jgi:hypothetical protein
MITIRIKAGAGSLGSFKFIFMQQDRRQERPIPTDPGFYRMDGAAPLFIKNTSPRWSIFHCQAQGCLFQIIGYEIFHRNFHILGNEIDFTLRGQDAAPPLAALAALLTCKNWFCRFAGRHKSYNKFKLPFVNYSE